LAHVWTVGNIGVGDRIALSRCAQAIADERERRAAARVRPGVVVSIVALHVARLPSRVAQAAAACVLELMVADARNLRRVAHAACHSALLGTALQDRLELLRCLPKLVEPAWVKARVVLVGPVHNRGLARLRFHAQ
jgi:hypothetical protein